MSLLEEHGVKFAIDIRSNISWLKSNLQKKKKNQKRGGGGVGGEVASHFYYLSKIFQISKIRERTLHLHNTQKKRRAENSFVYSLKGNRILYLLYGP